MYGDYSYRVDEKRILQILLGAELAMGLVVVDNFIRGFYTEVSILVTTMVILGIVPILLKKHRRNPAVVLLLGSMTFMLCVLTWNGLGLRDAAIVAFPGVLIFAAMLGGARLFTYLLAAMVLNVSALAVAGELGLHTPVIRIAGYGAAFDITAILLVVAYSAWLLIRDLRTAHFRLYLENEKVRESQVRIEYVAHHDQLTGLPNRHLAKDRFEQSLAHSNRSKTQVGLLYLDLDHFKHVNDFLGHGMGDVLLKECGARISQLLRGTDSVCRLGGDEFLVIVGQIRRDENLVELAQKILTALRRPFAVGGQELHCGASMGIACSPRDGEDFDELLKKADMAMYKSKDRGRDSFVFYDEQMNASLLKHLELLADMRRAIAEKQFRVFYQSKVDIVTDRVVGAEALARWIHPDKGMISPLDFIPVAESSGLIVEIGKWVLQQACAQCRIWHDQGYELEIAVNVSSVQLLRGGFEKTVAEALLESGIPAASLELELTESLLIDDTGIVGRSLAALRGMGVRVAIDDFGTGYSNLGYLKKFDVETLKIDKSFVQSMGAGSDQDTALVRAIVQMGTGLGLKTVAEGVENAATAQMLLHEGCALGQGFFWSKPVPGPEFSCAKTA